jgi:hypothetical protein
MRTLSGAGAETIRSTMPSLIRIAVTEPSNTFRDEIEVGRSPNTTTSSALILTTSGNLASAT